MGLWLPQQKPPRGAMLNPSHPLARGLAGAWLLNEASGSYVWDYSGNNRVGTLSNASWTAGGVLIENSESRITADWTMANTAEGTLTIIATPFFSHTDLGKTYYLWDTYGGSDRRFLLYKLGVGDDCQIYTDSTFRGNRLIPFIPFQTQILTVSWPLNDVYNNGEYLLTFDDGNLGSSASTIYFGDRYTDSNESFYGIFKTIYQHNRVLSAEEVRLLHQNPYAMFMPAYDAGVFEYVASGPATPTKKIVIVDTDTNVTIVSDPVPGPGECHYRTLQLALTGETGVSPKVITGADLVTNDEQLTIKCRASDGTADASRPNITGFTDSATCFVKVIADEGHRHAGIWDATKYRIDESTAHNSVIFNALAYTRIEGLQIKNGSHDGDGITLSAAAQTSASDIRLIGCIVNGSGGGRGIVCENNSNYTIVNCITDNFNRGLRRFRIPENGVGILYNNLAINCSSTGFQIDHGTASDHAVRVINNIAIDCNEDFALNGTSGARTTATNFSSDATSPQTDLRGLVLKSFVDDIDIDAVTKGTDNWIICNDPANGDYSLVSVDDGGELNDVIEAGTDLSEDTAFAFNDDIIGTTRPQGTAWDIGAFEFVDATPGPATPTNLQGTPSTNSILWTWEAGS